MNFSFVPFDGLIWIFVYVLAAQTSAGQAGPKFKTVYQRVWKNNSRDFKILLLFWAQIRSISPVPYDLHTTFPNSHVKYERITKISKKRYELAGTYLNESFITRLGSLLSTYSSSLLPSLNFLKLGIKSVGCHLLERHSSSEIVPIPLLCVLWCLR